MLAIHVDDGILIGADNAKLDNLLKRLKSEFEITEVDEPNLFLGIELEKNNEYLKLSQTNYIKQVLNKYRMEEAKSCVTPMVLSNEPEDESYCKPITFPYREALGSLVYITTKTRPDISYAVGYCTRHAENPREKDLKNIKRIFRYLQGTLNLGICYENDNQEDLVAYCDADYAGDTEDRKSTSGYVIYYCGGPVSWRSRKQPIVATSSTEAEYISAADVAGN